MQYVIENNPISYKGNIKDKLCLKFEKIKLSNSLRQDLMSSSDEDKIKNRLNNPSIEYPFKVKELLDYGLTIDNATLLAGYNDAMYQKIKEIASRGLYDRYAFLQHKFIPSNFHEDFFQMSDDEYNIAVVLLNMGFKPDLIPDLIKNIPKNEILQASLVFSFGGFSPDESLYFSKQIIENNFDKKDVETLAKEEIFTPRIIADILRSGKKNEILNSSEYKQIKPIFQEVYKYNKAFGFKDKSCNKYYIQDELSYGPYDFLLNEFFKIKDVDLREYKIEDKINLYFELLDFLNNKNRFKNDEQTKIGTQKCLEKLHYSLLNPITIIPVSKTKIAEFMKNFMANNNPKIEKTIANFDYEKYEQIGFPLKYSRENYLKDLNLILSSCDDIKKQEIYKKLEITPVSSDDKIGYDGVIALNNLNTDDEIEKRVFEISNKFINDNEILTDNFEFNQIINSLIKAVPEFVNIIGKHQHRKQTLDIHSFMVLRNILKNPEYKNQTNKNKIVLKFAALLHDISKKEFIKDSSHPINSSSYAKAIISKLNLNKNYSSQIVELISKHHWLADLSNKIKNEEEIAFDLKNKDMFELACIFTDADLKAVNEKFYNSHVSDLKNAKESKIPALIEKYNSTGQVLFSSKIVKPQLIPEIEYQGRKYKVINFSDYKSNEDLAKIGFEPNTTKDNLRFFIHMASSKKDLDSVMRLSELDVNSVLCASYVSLVQKKTYQNYAFGLSLDVKPENIVNSYYTNQFSGKRKGDARLRGMYHPESDYRRYLPDCFMSCARITSRDYADIYKSIADYKTLSQVRDDDIYQTRFRIINGFELKNLIKNMGNKLVNHFQNEANLYKSKPNALVAKVKHFEDIPQEYLDFAYENSLPIFILGK